VDRDLAKIESFRRALAWTTSNARELLENRPSWIRLVKRLAEIAMLANYVIDGRLGRFDPGFEEDARRWLELAWQRTRRGDLLVEAIASEPAWTSLAMTYAEFHRHGLRNPRLDDLLAQRADAASHEWFVQLATGCAYRALGIPSRHDVSALASQAWCVRIPELQIADIGRMYETTHVIMWLAERDLTPAVRERLRRFVPRWIEHYRVVQNPDLVAELVVAAHRLGDCGSDETWRWLLGRQTEDGSLREMDSPTRVLGRWHVTFAFALALAACLGDLCLRPAERGGPAPTAASRSVRGS